VGYPEGRGVQGRGISPDRIFSPQRVHEYRHFWLQILGVGVLAAYAAAPVLMLAGR
jgi:hypothetical protein